MGRLLAITCYNAATMPSQSLRLLLLALPLLLLLAGCDVSALLADPKAAQKAADAKAIGNACRHGMRSIEDCYSHK